jgi:hypothetical protein
MHSGEGLLSKAVELQAVFDQFGYGYPEPEAIQKFVRFARTHWQPPPDYLLFVGDSSYDPLGHIAPQEANRLPVFLVRTEYGGETVSDVGFVQINDDPWPDIAMGWFPARNPGQVRTVVRKILAYERVRESNHTGYGVVAIADGQSPLFREDAQAFLNLFPDDYPGQLYAPDAGVEGANQEVKRYFEDESWIVAYFGHGSVNMWGKDRLFTTEDVFELENNTYPPIVINMTCLTGLFTHPKVESLAETLLWKDSGGAVALLAPSSLTLPGDQSFLSQALVEAMLANPGARLGDIHLQARRKVLGDSPGSMDVVNTFMLFGDPALRLEK